MKKKTKPTKPKRQKLTVNGLHLWLVKYSGYHPNNDGNPFITTKHNDITHATEKAKKFLRGIMNAESFTGVVIQSVEYQGTLDA